MVGSGSLRSVKIGLISPAHGHRHILDLKYPRDLFLGASASTCMPMVLTILDALTPHEYDVDIIDEQVDDIDFDVPYDLVALTVLSPLATRAYQVADEFRKRGVWVAMGGLHPTLMPDEAAQHADTVCIGEAEGMWPDFLRDFVAGKTKPRYEAYRSVDMATCVIPRWDRLRSRRYRFFSIQASRGCRYNCDYCSVRAVFGNTRYKPIPRIMREIEEVRKHVLPRSDRFLLVDDNLFSDINYAKDFMRALIPLGLKWECFAPLNVACDPEILDLLDRSGCKRLSIGIESISQVSLAGVNKGAVNKYAEYKDNIARIYDRGIPIVGLMMVGFDGDDESIFERTAEFIQITRIAYPIFSIVTPCPKTALWTRLEQEGRLLYPPWDDYDGTKVVFRPKRMSVETLQNGYYWLFKQVYGSDAVFDRTIWLWEQGVVKSPTPETHLRLLLSAILAKETIRQRFARRDMLPFIRRTLKELWQRERIDIVTLLLNLGLVEYVNQLPAPVRDFRGATAVSDTIAATG